MIYQGYKVSKFVFALGLYFAVVILGVFDVGFGSLLKFFALIPIVFALSKLTNCKIQSYLRPIFLYYIFAICSYFWSVNPEETKDTAVSFASLVAMIVCVTTQVYNQGEISFLRKSIVWSSRITLVAAWLFGASDGGRLYFHGDYMNEDPNYLCAYLYAGIAFCVNKLTAQDRTKHRVIFVLELLAYFFTIFSTGSRGGLLGGMVVALFMFVRNSSQSLKQLIPKLALGGIILFSSFYIALSFVNSDVMDRFSGDALRESDGSGRYEIWEDAINAFENYEFPYQYIGMGLGATRTVARMNNFGHVNVMHNVFLENLIGLGLIGTILYLISIYLLYKKSRGDSFIWAVNIGMLVMALSTSIVILKPYWNVSLYIIILTYMSTGGSKNYKL